MSSTQQAITTGDIEHAPARGAYGGGARVDIWAGSPTITLGGRRFRADTLYISKSGDPVSVTLTRTTKSGEDHKRARRGGYIRLDDVEYMDAAAAAALRAVAAPALAAAQPWDLSSELRSHYQC